MTALASCASSIEFQPYRACVESFSRGSRQHDIGVVLGEDLGDDGARHYKFLPDRLRDDARQVIDVAETSGVLVRRSCPLISAANAAEHMQPLGSQGDQ
ncbi:MAG TPA: hypothetical protein VN181_03480 [Thermoanaerobaculia bacterium]|nr:hypothetical protein [Thermoanaerobaculia bacterium]